MHQNYAIGQNEYGRAIQLMSSMFVVKTNMSSFSSNFFCRHFQNFFLKKKLLTYKKALIQRSSEIQIFPLPLSTYCAYLGLESFNLERYFRSPLGAKNS